MIAHNQGAIGAMTDGKTIRLNAYGSFMAVNRQVPAQIGGMATLAATEISNNRSMDFQSDVSRAAFVLLHELGHRAGVLETDGYPADLEKERQAQERNNTKLFENCYAQGESK